MLAGMNVLARLLTAPLLLLGACGGSTSKHGSPVGLYELDKAALRAGILASMPAEKKEKPEEVAAVDKTVDTMSMTVELKQDGTAALSMKAKVGDQAIDQTAPGTWKADGDTLTITATQNGVDDVRVAVFEGSSFTIEQPSPAGPMKMTFRRR